MALAREIVNKVLSRTGPVSARRIWHSLAPDLAQPNGLSCAEFCTDFGIAGQLAEQLKEGITICMHNLDRGKAWLDISAPDEITILRSELIRSR